MAEERTQPPWNHPPIVPEELSWSTLLRLDGEALTRHYRHILTELSTKPGMLGDVFKKARQEIQNPATLKRLIVDLIDPVEEAHRAKGGRSRSRGAGLPHGGLEGPQEDVEDGAGGPGPVVEEGAQTLGNGEYPLVDGHVGEDVVHQVGRGLGHADTVIRLPACAPRRSRRQGLR